ncbi:hypothetical protein D3C71_1342380 [compost metagenome]
MGSAGAGASGYFLVHQVPDVEGPAGPHRPVEGQPRRPAPDRPSRPGFRERSLRRTLRPPGRQLQARRPADAAAVRFVAAQGHLRGGRRPRPGAGRPAGHRQEPDHHQPDRASARARQDRAVCLGKNGRAGGRAPPPGQHRPGPVLPGTAFVQGAQSRSPAAAGQGAGPQRPAHVRRLGSRGRAPGRAAPGIEWAGGCTASRVSQRPDRLRRDRYVYRERRQGAVADVLAGRSGA